MNYQMLQMPDCDLVSGVGYMRQFSVTETYPLHSHIDFYEVFYIQKGKAIHQVNGEQQLISQGSLVLIRPADIHKYDFLSNYDIEIISIGFLCEYMERACTYMRMQSEKFQSDKLPPHVILNGRAFEEIEKKLLLIEKTEPGEERRQYFLSILPQILYIYTMKKSANTDGIPIWLSKLIDEMSIEENFIDGLPRLLSLAKVSQEHLNREFRKHLRMTPTEFINMKRLNYAIVLLLERKNEIVDICYICGYNNLSYFYQVFKKQFNCSPKQFVKKIQGTID